MALRFVRKRHVPGLEPEDETGWFDGQTLDEIDRRQVTDIATNSAPRLDPDDAVRLFLDGGYADHREHFDELGSVPLEQWDVLDGDELVVHVWLYGVDGGVVYRARSSEVLGGLCQGYWDAYEGAPEGIGARLEVARVAAVREARENRAFPCELSSFRFA